jgi:hypothetical protein
MVLALLALGALLGLPPAVSGHHHAGEAPDGHHHGGLPSPDGDGSGCSFCLWQSHYAAEPAQPCDGPGPAVGRLPLAAPDVHAAIIATPTSLARAPPRFLA